jgi:hypothetical protein
MSKKSLLETNPFLKDPQMRMKIVETVTVSSASIEGVHAAAKKAMRHVTKSTKAIGLAHAHVSSSKARK